MPIRLNPVCCCIGEGSSGGSEGTRFCTPCCTDAPENDYDVDLGAGGLSADDCTGVGCGNIKGIFSAAFKGQTFSACEWEYVKVGYCPSTCGTPAGDCADTYTLLVKVSIFRVGANQCKMQVDVQLNLGGQDTCPCDRGGSAVYRMAPADPAMTSCSGTFTLTKISEDWTAACTGTLPAQITVTS